MTPSKLEVCTIETSFVLLVKDFLKLSKLNVLSGLLLQIMTFMPCFFNFNQGIKLELCSLSLMITSSPFFKLIELAIRFMPSVLFLVKMTSLGWVLRSFATSRLAKSISCSTLLANLCELRPAHAVYKV